jgi:hypothetical protein
MFYAVMGRLHALLGLAHDAVARRVRGIRRLAGESGQGTVEYVGLILLVSLLMVGMVAAMKGFNRLFTKTTYPKKIAEAPPVGGKLSPYLRVVVPIP